MSKKECKDFVAAKLKQLTMLPAPSAAAALSLLRRGVAVGPGQLPELWEWTIKGLSEESLCSTDEPTKEEWAVHLALTLYACHQQGNDIKLRNMHVDSVKFCSAIRSLSSGEGEIADERVLQRLKVAASADSIDALAYYLRQLISLLRSSNIPFNYIELAGDIYDFQLVDRRASVRLKWAQDYFRSDKNKNDNNNTKNEL